MGKKTEKCCGGNGKAIDVGRKSSLFGSSITLCGTIRAWTRYECMMLNPVYWKNFCGVYLNHDSSM